MKRNRILALSVVLLLALQLLTPLACAAGATVTVEAAVPAVFMAAQAWELCV